MRALMVLFGLLLSGPGLAQGKIAPGSLQNLIQADPACRQFNDGCSICIVVDGRAECSTPAIACIATGWTCAAKAADPAQADPPDAPKR